MVTLKLPDEVKKTSSLTFRGDFGSFIYHILINIPISSHRLKVTGHIIALDKKFVFVADIRRLESLSNLVAQLRK